MKKSIKSILISVAIIIAFIAFNIVADFINWNSGKCKMCGTPLKLVNVTNNEIRLYHYVCPKCGNTIEITYHVGGHKA